jgi:sugar phosphate isomerase/epimerase
VVGAVGRAKAADLDPVAFVERFGGRIVVAHLRDGDGTTGRHEPLADSETVAAGLGAEYNVVETKPLADIERRLAG